MCGISYHKTRYTNDAMNRIFKSNLLTIVSSRDKMLLKRMFWAAHVQPVDGHSNQNVHLPLNLTVNRFKIGLTAASSEGLKRMIRTFISKCPMCVLKSDSDGAFAHRLGDPALLGILGEESPLWHSVSLYLLGPFLLRQFHKARG